MESLHDEATRLGIEQPVVERYEFVDNNNVTVSALTPESEKAWSDYLRSITLAKLALL